MQCADCGREDMEVLYGKGDDAVCLDCYWDRQRPTLRDYFAAAALTGLLAARFDKEQDDLTVARCCYDAADSMLAAREVK